MAPQFNPLESYYRDFFFDNPRDLIQDLIDDGDANWSCRRWREFAVPGGAIDLLIHYSNKLRVVEFKRERIDENAVGQILRYMGIVNLLSLRGNFGGLDPIYVSGVLAAPEITTGAKSALDILDFHGVPLTYMQLNIVIQSEAITLDHGVTQDHVDSFERSLLNGKPEAIGWHGRKNDDRFSLEGLVAEHSTNETL